jgi:hypothetical protein
MRNRTYEIGCSKSKEHNRKAKKTIPLKTEEVSEPQTPCHEELFCEKYLETFRRKR